MSRYVCVGAVLYDKLRGLEWKVGDELEVVLAEGEVVRLELGQWPRVTVRGQGYVEACGTGTMRVHDDTRVVARDVCCIFAYDRCQVAVMDDAMVILNEESWAMVHGDAAAVVRYQPARIEGSTRVENRSQGMFVRSTGGPVEVRPASAHVSRED